MIKTITYPGGKSKVLNDILCYFPDYFQNYREPFAGGLSVGINTILHFPARCYWFNELDPSVYNFWKSLKEVPDKVGLWLWTIRKKFTDDSELFNFCQRTVRDSEPFEMGLMDWIIRRWSWGSQTGNTCNTKRRTFDMGSILHLKDLGRILQSNNVQITNLDYSEVLSARGDGPTFCFVDPPYPDTKGFYYGENGKLHEDFNHSQFVETIKGCPHDWLLTYPDTDVIRYRQFPRAYKAPLDVQNCVRGNGLELMISNYKFPLWEDDED